MKSVKKLMCLGVVTSLAFVSCKNNTERPEETTVKNIGINTEFIDDSVSPKEDFFQFINGKWLKSNEIPDDRTRWGSFDELRKMTDHDVLSILKKSMDDASIDANSDQGKAVNLYKSILDLEEYNFPKNLIDIM